MQHNTLNKASLYRTYPISPFALRIMFFIPISSFFLTEIIIAFSSLIYLCTYSVPAFLNAKKTHAICKCLFSIPVNFIVGSSQSNNSIARTV